MASEAILEQFQQQHLMQFASQLTPDERQRLEAQIATIDFPQLQRLTSGTEASLDWAELASRAEPPQAVRLGGSGASCSQAEALAAGEAALRGGHVGLILVAGGQGTRLGFDQPKGMFPIGPVSNRTLFQMHCDRLLAVMKRYDVQIPMYVMTSPATDAATKSYFADNDNCGLPEGLLQIFCQGTMPAVDASSGKVLLASKSEIAVSPDGHGGLVAALDNQGCLRDAKQRGVEHFFYAQVDNPLAQLCDPELIGYHLLAESQMTTQVVTKRFAKEKVGNVVSIDGKTQIIEYSDLPDSAAERTQPDGSLVFWAGNIAIHVVERQFLESVVANLDGLPFHRAHKPVPHVDSQGDLINPTEPNAIKFERFVFDLLPLASGAIVVEGDAAQIFAPVKNADGGPVDTPEHSKAALLLLHRNWLEAAGAQVAEGIQVEIHPDWALDAQEVASKLKPGTEFTTDTLLR